MSAHEARLIELKLALASGVRRLRERRGMTQAALARQLGSSRSRVAKMEAGDASVRFDLMIRSLLGIGAKPADIARLIRALSLTGAWVLVGIVLRRLHEPWATCAPAHRTASAG